MNENIFWIFETEVTGEIDALKTLMNEMVESNKDNEPGTLFYEWFISDDNKKCTLFERFDNSVNALNHAATFGKNYAPRFMEILKPKKFTVYGNPDAALKSALDKMGSLYMIPIGGFKR